LASCFFATDLHGHQRRYERLLAAIADERPAALFLGGDLLPGLHATALHQPGSFIGDFLAPGFAALRRSLGAGYPRVYLILGNDDPRCEEPGILEGEAAGLWHYLHGKQLAFGSFPVCGCSYVPPTPFLLKDWERYDVSRYVDPGCLSPEEGYRSVPESAHEIRYGTIRAYLDRCFAGMNMERAIFLFHAPPYDTPLDRADLGGRMHEHVALDVHIGSIAVRRFIEERQPLITLHGHAHESKRLTGEWKTRIGRTISVNGAHDGPELALVRFDPDAPAEASHELL
jgi:Icc-related predicted phosphoesterase